MDTIPSPLFDKNAELTNAIVKLLPIVATMCTHLTKYLILFPINETLFIVIELFVPLRELINIAGLL